jgi:hypothetical protein
MKSLVSARSSPNVDTRILVGVRPYLYDSCQVVSKVEEHNVVLLTLSEESGRPFLSRAHQLRQSTDKWSPDPASHHAKPGTLCIAMVP